MISHSSEKPKSGLPKYKIKDLLYPTLSLLASFLVGSLIILLISDKNPVHVYRVLLKSGFGSINALDSAIVKAIPFMFTGLSYAIARQCGVINLGAEGQFMMGALGAAVVGIKLEGLPPVIHLLLTLFAGFMFGALFGVVPAILKLKFGASELITTIMMNFIATYIIGWAVTGPMQETTAVLVNPQTALIPDSAKIHRIIGGQYTIHYGIFLVLLVLIIYYLFVWKSALGFQIRVAGLNRDAGEYAGMNVRKMALLSMFLAGGFAGLGGCVEIIAVQGRLMNTSFSISYGFTGIAVALLGNNTPLGILISGILFGGLQSGALKMQILTGISSSMSQVIQALVIIFFAGRELFRGFINKLIPVKANSGSKVS